MPKSCNFETETTEMKYVYGVFLFCNGLFLPIFFLVLGFVLQMTDDAMIGTNILKICARAF